MVVPGLHLGRDVCGSAALAAASIHVGASHCGVLIIFEWCKTVRYSEEDRFSTLMRDPVPRHSLATAVKTCRHAVHVACTCTWPQPRDPFCDYQTVSAPLIAPNVTSGRCLSAVIAISTVVVPGTKGAASPDPSQSLPRVCVVSSSDQWPSGQWPLCSQPNPLSRMHTISSSDTASRQW